MIEDVLNPKTKVVTDPKIVEEKVAEGDAKYFEDKKRAARAKRELEDEERQARQAREAEQHPPEPPFTVKGSIDMGHFDMQAQQQELRSTIDKIQEDSREEIKALNGKNEHYRDDLQRIQVTMVENTLKAQIGNLEKMMAEGLARPKDPSIVEQINQIGQIAGVLGYAKPGADDALPSEVRLKMFEMDINEKQAQRKFEWDKMMSERGWSLELKKMEQLGQQQTAQLQLEREKRGMWITPFESIGTAIARGFVDSGGQVAAPAKKKRSSHKLEAGMEDSGTVECPECGEPIAIAPQARSAVCPSCEARISISRIPNEAG